MSRSSKILGGILLVSGTTIGAAMLALPVTTGLAGFFPSLLLLTLFWAYMTYTAFLILEANLWMPESNNLITMARNTLGKKGEIITWGFYLFLLYALTTAYIAGSVPIIQEFIYCLSGYKTPFWMGPVPLLAIFGYIIYHGTRSVDYINRFLMLGLILSYLLLTVLVMPDVNGSLLTHFDLSYTTMGISIIATSFGFHIIIPSLTKYLHRDVAALKKVILIGSSIPLFVYIIWELLCLGIIPVPQIQEGFNEGTNGAIILAKILEQPFISSIARIFSFFAILTSFLGVSMALTHFLADGFRISEQTEKGKTFLLVLTFLPPLILTFIDPRAFINALEYAGAFGVVVILGLLPALMVWKGRYTQNYATTYKTPGGKGALLITIGISCIVILLEIFNKIGIL